MRVDQYYRYEASLMAILNVDKCILYVFVLYFLLNNLLLSLNLAIRHNIPSRIFSMKTHPKKICLTSWPTLWWMIYLMGRTVRRL